MAIDSVTAAKVRGDRELVKMHLTIAKRNLLYAHVARLSPHVVANEREMVVSKRYVQRHSQEVVEIKKALKKKKVSHLPQTRPRSPSTKISGLSRKFRIEKRFFGAYLHLRRRSGGAFDRGFYCG